MTTQILITLQAMLNSVVAGIVLLEAVDPVLAAVIVFICGVINAGVTAWLSTPSGQRMVSKSNE